MIQLYVWTGVFTDYTDGIAFALAESIEEAQNLILEYMEKSTEDRGQLPIGLLRIYPIDRPIGFGIYGGS